ncbi:hypothetical protein [[Eubacterium] cellulosolvens]
MKKKIESCLFLIILIITLISTLTGITSEITYILTTTYSSSITDTTIETITQKEETTSLLYRNASHNKVTLPIDCEPGERIQIFVYAGYSGGEDSGKEYNFLLQVILTEQNGTLLQEKTGQSEGNNNTISSILIDFIAENKNYTVTVETLSKQLPNSYIFEIRKDRTTTETVTGTYVSYEIHVSEVTTTRAATTIILEKQGGVRSPPERTNNQSILILFIIILTIFGVSGITLFYLKRRREHLPETLSIKTVDANM